MGWGIYTNHNNDWNDCERGGFTLATTMIGMIVRGGVYTNHNNDWNDCGRGDLH